MHESLLPKLQQNSGQLCCIVMEGLIIKAVAFWEVEFSQVAFMLQCR